MPAPQPQPLPNRNLTPGAGRLPLDEANETSLAVRLRFRCWTAPLGLREASLPAWHASLEPAEHPHPSSPRRGDAFARDAGGAGAAHTDGTAHGGAGRHDARHAVMNPVNGPDARRVSQSMEQALSDEARRRASNAASASSRSVTSSRSDGAGEALRSSVSEALRPAASDSAWRESLPRSP